MFYLSKIAEDTTIVYKKLDSDKTEISYNADRTFNGPADFSDELYSGCRLTSIDILYTHKQAFNFVVSKPETVTLTGKEPAS